VVGGLAGAALGSALAAKESELAKDAIGGYWSLVGWTLLAVLVLGLAGLLNPAFWLLALGLLTVALPIVQAVASLIMFGKKHPDVRRAALKVTGAWLVFTLFGWGVTVAIYNSISKQP
jgi:hypothetical protein